MAPSYVKPYVKRQKNDAADAEAICEAVGRPTMRFVPVKTAEQCVVGGALLIGDPFPRKALRPAAHVRRINRPDT